MLLLRLDKLLHLFRNILEVPNEELLYTRKVMISEFVSFVYIKDEIISLVVV